MGLFGGDRTITSQETNVTTNTTTNIRDIGLTGAAAVDAIGLLEAGAIERANINAGMFGSLVASRDQSVLLSAQTGRSILAATLASIGFIDESARDARRDVFTALDRTSARLTGEKVGALPDRESGGMNTKFVTGALAVLAAAFAFGKI